MAGQVTEQDATKPPGRLDGFLDRLLRSPKEKVNEQAHGMSEARRCCTGDGRPILQTPAVLWEGVFSGYSGYGKANREIVMRVANSMAVEIRESFEPPYSDTYQRARYKLHEGFRVSRKAPFVRFFGPDKPVLGQNSPRVCYTMMETERIHADMINHLNAKFDELWCPTEWNLRAFKKSGMKIPGRVMPLGVDSILYRPLPKKEFPPCRLLSTKNVGRRERPDGFIFISVGLPSIRKGFDVLAKAFEDAFSDNKDVSLVCAVTHFSSNVEAFSGLGSYKSRIYALHGEYTEPQMARIYSSADAYASASRGEGWNLPVCEAAACGLPVICPNTTSHREVVGSDGFMFHAEGFAPIKGAESISPWYHNVPFSVFGKKSHDELVSLLRRVYRNRSDVKIQAEALKNRVQTRWTWDNAAARVTRRLMEMQPE